MKDFDFDFESLSEPLKILISILIGIIFVAIGFALFIGPIVLAICFASFKPLLLYIVTVGVIVGVSIYSEIC